MKTSISSALKAFDKDNIGCKWSIFVNLLDGVAPIIWFTDPNFFRKLNDQKKENIFHHIGIYCYEEEILKRFVSLKQSKHELEYKLEQLRALDNDININVGLANRSPIGVDTKEDFLAIKKIMKYK